MTSQPNLPYGEFKRLRVDDSTPVRWRVYNNGGLLNLSGRLFRVVLYEPNSTNVALKLENDALDRPEGNDLGLIQWNSDAYRDNLTSAAAYVGYVFELINGKQEPRGWFRFTWATEPPTYEDGKPLEPAEMTLNDTGQQIPLAGVPQLLILNGRPVFKAADGTYELLPTSPL